MSAVCRGSEQQHYLQYSSGQEPLSPADEGTVPAGGRKQGPGHLPLQCGWLRQNFTLSQTLAIFNLGDD